MAIGYGVAVPKGKTRKQIKAKKDRADAKQLKAFRDAVWQREGDWLIDADADADRLEWARCQLCGAPVHRPLDYAGPLTGEVHHRISRRHKATGYDPDNGVLLCNHLVNNCHQRAELGLITV